MAEAKTSSKKGLTRGKAILIGVLSIALVVILYIQFGGGGDKPAGKPSATDRRDRRWQCNPANSAANPLTLASAKTPSNAQAGKDKDAAAGSPSTRRGGNRPSLKRLWPTIRSRCRRHFHSRRRWRSERRRTERTDSLPRPRPMMRRSWPRQWKSCTCNWKS